MDCNLLLTLMVGRAPSAIADNNVGRKRFQLDVPNDRMRVAFELVGDFKVKGVVRADDKYKNVRKKQSKGREIQEKGLTFIDFSKY